MTSIRPLNVLKSADPIDVRSYYENAAQDMLWLLWRRKWMIATIVAASLFVAILVLMRMGPRYSSEAIIQLNFTQEDAERGVRSVSVDATALVDSAARIIRSRAIADSVVNRLGLPSDSRYGHEPFLSHVLATLRGALGLQDVRPTPQDLAVNALMRRVRVTNDPRSYVISVAATSDTPDDAARLANAVASEYVRRQALQRVGDARDAAARELGDTAMIYGLAHPNYLRALARLQQVQSRLNAVVDATAEDDTAKPPSSQFLIPARSVITPSGPDVPVVLGLALVFSLAGGIWLARRSARPGRESKD